MAKYNSDLYSDLDSPALMVLRFEILASEVAFPEHETLLHWNSLKQTDRGDVVYS